MEAKIEAFNWDLNWFLTNLTSFRSNVNIPNEATLRLFGEVLTAINSFVNNWSSVEPIARPDIFDWSIVNQNIYELQRSFHCRICKQSFPATRQDFIFHVTSTEHNSALFKRSNDCDRPAGNVCTSRCMSLVDQDQSKNNRFNPISRRDGQSTLTNRFANSTFKTSSSSVMRARKRKYSDQDEIGLREVSPIRFSSRSVNLSAELKGQTVNKSFFKGVEAFLSQAASKRNDFLRNPWHSVIIRDVKDLLNTKFHSIECDLIGSRINGTTDDGTASLDIYLDLDESYWDDKPGAVHIGNIVTVKKLLERSKEWTAITRSGRIRFHTVSATHKESKINCRFVSGTGVFVKNNDVVNCLLDAQQACRQLVLCIRMSMENENAPHWTRKFSGYIISLLVIFFFQAINRLPSIKSMQKEINPKKCGENNVAFRPPHDIIICKDRLSVLLMDFFSFYSNFNFATKIISPYEGRTINHSILQDENRSLPDSVLRFKRFVELERGWNRHVMCVQDIFMHKHNVTQAIDSEDIGQFKNYCTQSFKILRKANDLDYQH